MTMMADRDDRTSSQTVTTFDLSNRPDDFCLIAFVNKYTCKVLQNGPKVTLSRRYSSQQTSASSVIGGNLMRVVPNHESGAVDYTRNAVQQL